jgi:hypothetical protein
MTAPHIEGDHWVAQEGAFSAGGPLWLYAAAPGTLCCFGCTVCCIKADENLLLEGGGVSDGAEAASDSNPCSTSRGMPAQQCIELGVGVLVIDMQFQGRDEH